MLRVGVRKTSARSLSGLHASSMWGNSSSFEPVICNTSTMFGRRKLDASGLYEKTRCVSSLNTAMRMMPEVEKITLPLPIIADSVDEKSTFNSDTVDEKDTKGAGLVEDKSELTVEAILAKAVELNNMKPSEIVVELERHIVGQTDAKRAVAIALRNRWRRQQLPADLRKEIVPRNILMIGPTGCGKTEIARRLSDIANAPFLKVEATKFTEVGFHGRDVDMIIRDLVEQGVTLIRKLKREALLPVVQEKVAHLIIKQLVGTDDPQDMKKWLKMYHEDALDKTAVEVEVPTQPANSPNLVLEGGAGTNVGIPLAELMGKLQQGRMGAAGGPQLKKKKMLVPDARKTLEDHEIEKLLDGGDLAADAIKLVEQNGIVFIDEIDKICNPDGSRNSGDASDEGVQRDLLPLIEGSIISTKHGNVNTDYILFIASGAFHHCKPSDLLPELQGRLPIRVELAGLKEEDLLRILTEPEANLIRQQVALLKAEGIDLEIEESAVKRIAAVAAEMNSQVENIGARRLHTVTEKLIEELSFDASDMEPGSKVVIDEAMVNEKLGTLLQKMDLQKFIL
eukprot:g3502.t1